MFSPYVSMASCSVHEREVSEWATEVTKLQQWWWMQQEWREGNNFKIIHKIISINTW